MSLVNSPSPPMLSFHVFSFLLNLQILISKTYSQLVIVLPTSPEDGSNHRELPKTFTNTPNHVSASMLTYSTFPSVIYASSISRQYFLHLCTAFKFPSPLLLWQLSLLSLRFYLLLYPSHEYTILLLTLPR